MQFVPSPFNVIHWDLHEDAPKYLPTNATEELFPTPNGGPTNKKNRFTFSIRWTFRLHKDKITLFSYIGEKKLLVFYESKPDNMNLLRNQFALSLAEFRREFDMRKKNTLLADLIISDFVVSDQSLKEILDVFEAESQRK